MVLVGMKATFALWEGESSRVRREPLSLTRRPSSCDSAAQRRCCRSAVTMEESIYSVFSSVFGVSASLLSATSSPDTILGWDSFGHVELIEALERTFSVRFAPDEIPEMQNLGAIQQVLRRRLGSPG